jgi:hypothetical protein
VDTDAFLSASSGEKDARAEVDTEDDEVSMDELEAAEASSESTPVASASKPMSAEEAVEEHATVGVVSGIEKIMETTPVVVTSSGGTELALLGAAVAWIPPCSIQVLPLVNMPEGLEGEALCLQILRGLVQPQ